MRKAALSITSISLALGVAGCAAYGEQLGPAAAATPPVWGYEGPAGPENWGALSEE